MSNLKLDIIYYQTSSDFEMEFNLSGCCRMRIFKDKIESKKEFVSALAKDVARSKIILIVTELFGEKSAIPTLASAVGLSLTSADKDAFGIKNEEEILIPNNAVPLVTKSGIFGGCIIESGPQAIIVVSNLRALRHEVMKAYVHNYIFDVGQLFAYQERMGQSVVLSPVVLPEANEELTVGEKETQISLNKAEETTAIDDTVLTDNNNSDEKQNPDINSGKNLFDNLKAEQKKAFVEPEINQTFDLEEVSVTVETKKVKKTKKATSIILLVTVILLLIAFGVLAYFFVYLPALGMENPILSEQGGLIYDILKNLS